MTNSLFIRQPETLEGFQPPFNRAETLLGLETIRHQVGGEGAFRGLGVWEDDKDYYKGPPVYEYTYYVTVAGYRFTGPGPFGNDDDYDRVAVLANWFLANAKNEIYHPAAWAFLKKNAAALNVSKMFWKAMDHRSEVDKTKAQIAKLQERVDRAELLASLYAIEVKHVKRFTETEKAVVWAELTGGMSWPPPRIEDYFEG